VKAEAVILRTPRARSSEARREDAIHDVRFVNHSSKLCEENICTVSFCTAFARFIHSFSTPIAEKDVFSASSGE
jgi:hypothetical protein